MRKTKIVCTIGPASDSENVLRKMMEAGFNAARLNFSHGDYEEHGKRIALIKKLREEMNKPVGLILDTKGPEIRTGDFVNGSVDLIEGQKFTVTTREVLGDNTICSVSYKKLHEDVKVNNTILIADGLVALRIDNVNGQDMECTVLNGGTIGNRKNVNLPDVKTNLPSLTDKDIEDIKYGISQGIDMIAASFIRKGADVLGIRKVLEKNGGEDIGIISKIENQEGIDNIDDIIKFSDGIMVARGDLGVQIPTEDVPVVQKMIITKCNKAGKPVITATQMLDSMIRNPRPTRAEASDVANAIYDGSDAIMLSGETAGGKYPVEALSTMGKIAEKVEQSLNYEELTKKRRLKHALTVPDAISYAAVSTAMELNASAIVTATQSGSTAKMVSKYRPFCNIIAVTPYERVARKLSLVWGVYPIVTSKMESSDEVIDTSVKEAYTHGLVKKGDLVVIAAGVPVGFKGTTNMIKVHIVGDVLVQGKGIGPATYGNACVAKDLKSLKEKLNNGDIIVVKNLDKNLMEVLDRVSGVIAEEGGITSHIAVECISRGIPIITGAADARSIIRNGTLITMDTTNGMVYGGKANIV
ncbi:MAG TPA: pyruvate kinase [Clostridiaceae bacterium]|jgi:pyruvate kinase|nr:pyruvate kinase [Clostridiaceae bacterium]HBF77074.1 pyruvate kinase [Clostridiaceae bacterium]HBG38212.1 pyruvate kinase [Clostridiaceae bacterium]HBN28721.1 pyruvate kinase [Clostridiaceae bacterium]HBX47422.1 pyruvate kinase [Clostridiaceae bacterium]